jgi:hypothetical protein
VVRQNDGAALLFEIEDLIGNRLYGRHATRLTTVYQRLIEIRHAGWCSQGSLAES